jgi:hypothetical protein
MFYLISCFHAFFIWKTNYFDNAEFRMKIAQIADWDLANAGKIEGVQNRLKSGQNNCDNICLPFYLLFICDSQDVPIHSLDPTFLKVVVALGKLLADFRLCDVFSCLRSPLSWFDRQRPKKPPEDRRSGTVGPDLRPPPVGVGWPPRGSGGSL